MNKGNGKTVGRPSKEPTRKRQKFGSTIQPELKEMAELYMAKHGNMETSEFLDKAIHELLMKECDTYRKRNQKPNGSNYRQG